MWYDMKDKAPGCSMSLETRADINKNLHSNQAPGFMGLWGDWLFGGVRGNDMGKRLHGLHGMPASALSLTADLYEFMPMHNKDVQDKFMLNLLVDNGNQTSLLSN